MKSKQYYWSIESIWEQYFQHQNIADIKSTNCEIEKFDFTASEKSVFLDEHGVPYKGLKKSPQKIQIHVPIYLVDNHHRVLSPFFEIFKAPENKSKPLHVVHIDAHRDDAIYPNEIDPKKNLLNNKDLKNIENQCRVCDYLNAGKRIGLIEKVYSVTQSSEFENFTPPSVPYVLNLDIDIYGPEGDAVFTKLKTNVIAQSWKHASAICIATSPGFIDADHAKRIIEIFIKYPQQK